TLASPPPLPRTVAREVFAELCASLPPPSVNTPEAQHARDELAMDAVVALCPADAFEVKLAVRIVAEDAQATDSLRLARLAPAAGDSAEHPRCLAQPASMSPQSDSPYRLLQRRQATRDKQLEADPAAMQRDGCWFGDAAQSEPQSPPPDPAPAPPS